jgi:hypothetical protein
MNDIAYLTCCDSHQNSKHEHVNMHHNLTCQRPLPLSAIWGRDQCGEALADNVTLCRGQMQSRPQPDR